MASMPPPVPFEACGCDGRDGKRAADMCATSGATAMPSSGGSSTADEIAELAAAFDRIWREGLRHPESFRHGNVFYRIAETQRLGRVVRYMQWPSYIDPVLDRFRQDPRMLAIVAPLLGVDLKQIINQMHWKPPGAAMAEFGYHQDIRFRRPRSAYRDPADELRADRHRHRSAPRGERRDAGLSRQPPAGRTGRWARAG